MTRDAAAPPFYWYAEKRSAQAMLRVRVRRGRAGVDWLRKVSRLIGRGSTPASAATRQSTVLRPAKIAPSATNPAAANKRLVQMRASFSATAGDQLRRGGEGELAKARGRLRSFLTPSQPALTGQRLPAALPS
jgi:hypothetical protein